MGETADQARLRTLRERGQRALLALMFDVETRGVDGEPWMRVGPAALLLRWVKGEIDDWPLEGVPEERETGKEGISQRHSSRVSEGDSCGTQRGGEMNTDYAILEKVRSMISTWLQIEHDIAPKHIKVEAKHLRFDNGELDIFLEVMISLPITRRRDREEGTGKEEEKCSKS